MLRRSSIVLWAVALALVVVLFAAAFLAESGLVIVSGWGVACPGFDLYDEVGMVLQPLAMVPQPVIVLVGFGLWLLLVRTGSPRWGRAVGWLTGLGLTWGSLMTLGFAAVDLAVEAECARSWAPFFALDGFALWNACDVLAGVLILVAVRVPGTRRRGWISRTAAAAVAVLLLLSLQTGDAALGKATWPGDESCDRWHLGYGSRPVSRADREQAFVCVVRRETYVLPRALGDRTDSELVALGRNLCRASMRADPGEIERLRARTGVDVAGVGTTQALALLCPEVDAREQAERQRQDAENDAFNATAKERCATGPPRRPRIRPAVRGTAPVWSDFGAVTAVENEDWNGASLDKAFGNDLVGAVDGEVSVLTADEAMHVCVTVEGYGRRPPVERAGWEKVVEIGYTSPTGELSTWEDETFPDPLVKGPGRYRIRVHVRGSAAALEEDGDARQRFLVMVYPGESRGTVVLKK
ncbi:hypothetical protein [Nonomuraea sp. NPDC003804]|uniref:hypothetical protein n=1 Tax=Nonomuraea sp. NPDC003804 TaxID=3154547 RepID=UPI0033AFC605